MGRQLRREASRVRDRVSMSPIRRSSHILLEDREAQLLSQSHLRSGQAMSKGSQSQPTPLDGMVLTGVQSDSAGGPDRKALGGRLPLTFGKLATSSKTTQWEVLSSSVKKPFGGRRSRELHGTASQSELACFLSFLSGLIPGKRSLWLKSVPIKRVR